MSQNETTKRVAIALGALSVCAGPAYEVQTEDGPATRWDHFVTVTVERREWTLAEGFRHESDAERMLERIQAHGTINLAKWVQGSPWRAYEGEGGLEERWAEEAARERAERYAMGGGL